MYDKAIKKINYVEKKVLGKMNAPYIIKISKIRNKKYLINNSYEKRFFSSKDLSCFLISNV